MSIHGACPRLRHLLLFCDMRNVFSRIAGGVEQEGDSADPTVQSQIQTESMQAGSAMQHLGALLLELGQTMMTLCMGQSSYESSMNAGPTVYISLLGPNPIMVQGTYSGRYLSYESCNAWTSEGVEDLYWNSFCCLVSCCDLCVHSFAKPFLALADLLLQAIMNFHQKSTIGFSIDNILLDLLGGLTNYGQMAVQSIDQPELFSITSILTFTI